MVGIYKITSPSNKIYVGQTWNTKRRIYLYSIYHCCGQRKLFNSLKKYGWESHKWEMLYELPADIDQNTLDRYESFYIDQFKEAGLELLNIKNGGSRGKHAEETKRKIGLSKIGNTYMKGRVMSDETKQKLSNAHKGKKLSQEQKQKLSWKGRKHSEETKKRMGLTHAGKTLSEQTKKKLSDINTGKIVPKEVREKIRVAHKGRKRIFSEEHRKNLSLAGKKRGIPEKTRKKMRETLEKKRLSRIMVVREKYPRRLDGHNNPMFGKRHSEETRRKIAEKAKHRIISEETRQKLSMASKGNQRAKNAFLGRKHTEETKKKMSESMTGLKRSEESRKRMSEARKRWTQKILNSSFSVDLW